MYEPLRHHGLFKPKEIAEKAGVLTSKIAFYAALNLLRPADLSEGGQKLYDENETLLQLDRIKKLTEKGFSLEKIRGRISFVRGLHRLLIIEDEKEVSDLVKDTLEDQANFDMDFAADGFTAGKMLNNVFPDLIILDLNLPGINGFDLCKAIRSDKYQRGVKILAMSGYYSPENAKLVLDSGADLFLPKPFDIEEFKSTVFSLLNIRKRKKKKPTVSENNNEDE